MGSKYKKIIEDFYSLTHNDTDQTVNIEAYLKAKSLQFTSTDNIDWKAQLMEAYGKLKITSEMREKMTVICEQLMSQTDRLIKNKDLELQLIVNELNLTRSALQQEKHELNKIHKQHESALKQQRKKTTMALQKLEQKQYQLRQMQEKIQQYEQEIQQIKSTEYQHMINSIKEEEILNSQTQTLFKENTLLKHQLKEANNMNNTLNKIIAQIKTEAETYQLKYQKTKRYIHNKLNQQKQNKTLKQKRNINPQNNTAKIVETPINLIEFKDDFSFKDSIQNQNNSILVPNHPPSFLHFDSSSERFYASQQSPSRGLRQRDFLNLTDRDPSTHSKNSKNITKHLLRSKKNLQEDKENISQNTWDYNDFDTYDNEKRISKFGSKRHQNTQKQILPSNGSVDGMLPSQRRFQTQERSSLLSKHRRIKSSFCGKSIHEFQQYENSHFIMNSQKLTESLMENTNRNYDEISEQTDGKNNIENESSIVGYDVNEIVINEELISSYKTKTVKNEEGEISGSVQVKNMRQINMHMGMIDAKMITSVQVKPQTAIKQKQTKSTFATPQMDLYYAFFSLTAQCAKLNHKNFNQAISVYFNLEQEYNNVVKKMIPINKWYNYIHDQIQTSLKYQR